MHQGSAILWESAELVRIAALGKAWERQSANFLDLTQRLPRRMFPLTAELGSGPALWGRVAE